MCGVIGPVIMNFLPSHPNGYIHTPCEKSIVLADMLWCVDESEKHNNNIIIIVIIATQKMKQEKLSNIFIHFSFLLVYLGNLTVVIEPTYIIELIIYIIF